MSYGRRLLRTRVLETLERRVRQFHSREEILPFRAPNEPLDLEALITDALLDYPGTLEAESLRSRGVMRLDWREGGSWDAWVITLPSGVFLYCDSDGQENRLLASVKRGSPEEADRFFLELLAESCGEHFGIEMSGGAPDRVSTYITDRAFLTDIFVELYEGKPPQRSIERALARVGIGRPAVKDFRADVQRWLDVVLATPTPAKGRRARRHFARLREEHPR